MITETTIYNAKSYCKDDIKEIEGYNEAIISENKYCCHHKNGINISKEELIEKGLYYNRPADELIFLEFGEHTRLHMKGVNHKGENNPIFGKHLSDETKQKISNNHADFKGAKNPRAKECTINGVTYGCLGNAHKALYPNISFKTFSKRYRKGEL